MCTILHNAPVVDADTIDADGDNDNTAVSTQAASSTQDWQRDWVFPSQIAYLAFGPHEHSSFESPFIEIGDWKK